MKTVGPVALLTLLIAGCLGQGGEPTGPSSPSPTLAIASGEAVLSRPDVEAGELFSMSLKGFYAYRAFGARTEDSAACALALTNNGWAMASTGVPRTPFNTFLGRRADGQTAWTVAGNADFAATYGAVIIGHSLEPERDTYVLVGREQVGPDLESGLTVEAEGRPMLKAQAGRFWCLDGLARFTEGEYLATNTYVHAATVGWTEEFRHGIIARVQASANATGLHFDGPTGRQDAPAALWNGTRLDATFCSKNPSSWRFGADSLTADRVWHLQVGVFDATHPGIPCDGWRPSAASDLQQH